MSTFPPPEELPEQPAPTDGMPSLEELAAVTSLFDPAHLMDELAHLEELSDAQEPTTAPNDLPSGEPAGQ